MAETTNGPLPSLAPLLPDIRELADEIERARRIPDDLAKRLAAAGLIRMLVPESHGGGEVHPGVFFDTLASAATADASTSWVIMIGATTGLLSASLPEEWARAVYNPDTITCGVVAPYGRAVPVEGGMRVSGRWPFGSASQVSDWICGGCFIMEDGEPRKGPYGPQSLLMFFPADDVTIHEETWDTSGLRGTGSHDIEVEDVFVPEGRWAELGRRARVDAPLYRFPTLGLLALGVSAVAIGTAEHAIEHFIELATNKVPTGARSTLAQRAAAQRDLARAQGLVAASRAFSHQAISEAWEASVTTGKLDLSHKARLRLAATNNAWSAAEAVDLLYHAAGGSAIYARSPLQRCFRDVHVATQHAMVAQPTFEVIGRIGLGMEPKQLL